MDISLIDEVTTYLLLLTWAAYLGYRLGRDRAPSARSIILKLLGGVVLALILSISSRFPQSSRWMLVLEIGCLQNSLFLIYLASNQLLNNKPYLPLSKQRFFPLIMVAICIGAVLGALGGHHLETFLLNPAFQPAPLYTISFFWNYGLQFFFVLLTLRLYWLSLDRYTILTYLVRRLMGTASFFIAACALCLGAVNLLLFLLHEKSFHVPLSQAVVVSETLLLWLLVAGFVIPQEVMERMMRPLEDALAWRQWLQYNLLCSLHEKMIQVVPGVHLAYDELYDVRVLIELSDVRQIIWSHVPTTRPITVREDAKYLLSLLRQKRIITSPGPYQPAVTRQRNVLKHNLAVARRMRRYERRGRLQSPPPSSSNILVRVLTMS